eukprot:TRINITY_DN7062_c0_g1_i2.p1 TRINITY_DN7062_c0_g1~~TRINITY_DN7062_c0_g1_i2.p1  ORF type:complete len:385 (-),score=62.20 TRINITY_DN7062_c0_g1_i2:402-1556(-)
MAPRHNLSRKKSSIALPLSFLTLLLVAYIFFVGPRKLIGLTKIQAEDCVQLKGAALPKDQKDADKLAKAGNFVSSSISLAHDMTDEELLWRASFVPLRESAPIQRVLAGVPKIAFLFVTSGTVRLADFWARFFEGNQGKFSIYIYSANASLAASQQLPPVFRGRHVVSKGLDDMQLNERMRMVAAVRRLVGNALLDLSNERFFTVCEGCIPLYNFTFIYSYLIKSQHSFIPGFDYEGESGRGRYNISCFTPEVPLEQWRKGSLWISATRSVAVLVVADTKYYEKFAQCCIPTGLKSCYPDEHYLATVLHLLASREIANWCLTFSDWWTDPSLGHPYIFSEDKISPELLRSMRQCSGGVECPLLGQEFEDSSLPALLKLAPTIGF